MLWWNSSGFLLVRVFCRILFVLLSAFGFLLARGCLAEFEWLYIFLIIIIIVFV